VIRLRPDLDPQAELKIIEDFEVEDNEGLQVLPGVRQLLSEIPSHRWTIVTSATERLARVRLAAGGISVTQAIVTAEASPTESRILSRFLPALRYLGSIRVIAWSSKIPHQARRRHAMRAASSSPLRFLIPLRS